MNRPGKETLRRIIHKIHKQNDCEKFIELASVLTGMLRKFNFYSVELSSDVPYHSFPLSIKCIHCVIRKEECLYTRATKLAGTLLPDILLVVEPSPHKKNNKAAKRSLQSYYYYLSYNHYYGKLANNQTTIGKARHC